jgi:nucleoside-diphosphate-sugar epimerase
MILFVTGASGFLGKYVVAEGLKQGHQVRAVVRPAGNEQKLPWHNHPLVQLVRMDLRQPRGLAEALQGVDVVIHLAAAKAGDFYTQFAGTVIATENLLAAMTEAKVCRLVAISTFSVFDYLHIPSGRVIDEDSPLERNPLQRDEYAQTKLIQEELFREFERNQGGQVTIVRPGMVYGRDNLWNACLGAEIGKNSWLLIGSHAHMPLTYVENCADAIIAAAQQDEAIAKTINIVDDDLPKQSVYARKLIQQMPQPPRTVSISWTMMRLIAATFWLYNKVFLHGQAKLPGIFVPAKLHARFKPLRYTNKRAKQILNWTPKYSLDTALERSCSNVELMDTSYQIGPALIGAEKS